VIYTNMNIDTRKLNSFLHYGYVPQFESTPATLEKWLGLDRKKIQTLHHRWKQAPAEKIVEEGVNRIRSLIEAPQPESNCVPLSGGLDSRVVLGGLLDQISADDLSAIVCGVPGTRDFEIGSHVAECFGIKLETVDLSELFWGTEDLVEFANEASTPISLFSAYMYAQILHRGGRGLRYWSGFIGGELAGAHFPNVPVSSWQDARSLYARENRYSDTLSLATPSFDPREVLPEDPFIGVEPVNPYEQLDFAVRQRDFIRPQVLLDGYEIKAPFLKPDWVQFILSIPDAYRRDQHAYKKILQEAYPDLFSLPVKNNIGLPLDASPFQKYSKLAVEYLRQVARNIGLPGTGIDPRLNYIDVARSIREGALHSVVRENLKDLKARNVIPWIDIDEIWSEHQSGWVDHSDALDLLTSLEIHLKADTFS